MKSYQNAPGHLDVNTETCVITNINCSDLFAVDREADFHLYCADSCFALNQPLAVDRLVDTTRESHSRTVSHLVLGSECPVNFIGLHQDEQRPF